MKRLLIIMIALGLTISVAAQPQLDLGIKGGVNFSKLSFDMEDYSAESVTKSHFGAFARVGWDRLFIQPEFYFSGKGGDVTSDVASTFSSFNYTTFDVPVLLGYRIIKGKAFDVHLIGGPVLSNVTKEEVKDGNVFNESFFKKHYMSIQYGMGVDVLFMTIDAKMENGLSDIYTMNGESFKNNAFMLSIGFKIL